jgi:glycine cleavage system H protein
VRREFEAALRRRARAAVEEVIASLAPRIESLRPPNSSDIMTLRPRPRSSAARGTLRALWNGRYGRSAPETMVDSDASGQKGVSVMTVLLVILTFLAFIVLDAIVGRRAAPEAKAVGVPPLPAEPEPVWVAGYHLPEALHYHRGHTWARAVDPDTVAVGVDDFARRLIGRADEVRLPSAGTWLRQGEKAFGVVSEGRAADLVAPVEGEVTEVNRELLREPSLATDDPYGRGWVLKLRPAHLATSLRNLLSGSLARRWMQDAREGLDLRLMALSGSVLQDGGEPVAGLARHLSAEEWKGLVRDFLLT